MFKKCCTCMTVLLGLVLAIGIAGYFVGDHYAKEYLDLSIKDTIGIVWDATHSNDRQLEWNEEQDTESLMNAFNDSFYLKRGTITKNTIDEIVTIVLGKDKAIKDDASGGDNNGGANESVTDRLIKYLFDNILIRDNVDKQKLLDYEYPNDTEKVTINQNMLAALVEIASKTVLQKTDLLSSIDKNITDNILKNIKVISVKLDTTTVVDPNFSQDDLQEQRIIVPTMYASVGLQTKFITDALVSKLGLSGDSETWFRRGIDLFLPKNIYVEASVGIDGETDVPVELGLNNLTIKGGKYQDIKRAVKRLTSKIGKTIDLDDIISKPVNEKLMPLMRKANGYIDADALLNDHVIKTDLFGTILAMSGINDNKQEEAQLKTSQIVLALKAAYGGDADENNSYDQWYSELDKDGNIIIDEQGKTNQFKPYFSKNENNHKVNFAKNIALKYHLDIQGKDKAIYQYDDTKDRPYWYAWLALVPNIPDSFKPDKDAAHLYSADNIDELDIDWLYVYDQIMMILNPKSTNELDEFYATQFNFNYTFEFTFGVLFRKYSSWLKNDRLTDYSTKISEILDADPADQPALIEALLIDIRNTFLTNLRRTLSFNGGDLFAIASKQIEDIFAYKDIVDMKMQLISIAVKTVAVDANDKRTTLVMGIKMDLTKVAGQYGEAMRSVLGNMYLGLEIDITDKKQLGDKDRLEARMSINTLSDKETTGLFDLIKTLDSSETAFDATVFKDAVTNNFAQVLFDTMGASDNNFVFTLIAEPLQESTFTTIHDKHDKLSALNAA